MFKVLIACFDNWNTLCEIPFILKNGGCTVDVYCSSESWLLANSYHDKWIECSPDKKAYKNTLIDFAKSSNYDWIILGDEPLIDLINKEHLTEELFAKLLPINKIEYRYILSSKNGLSDFCKTNGILSPGFITYNNKLDLEKLS